MKLRVIKTKFKKIGNQGFTLVETLVAVGIFSVIMMVAAGSLLTIIDANAKAQAIKTAVNNVDFAVETISNALMTADPDTLACASNQPNSTTDAGPIDNTCNGKYYGISFVRNTAVNGEVIKYYIYLDKEGVIQYKKGNSIQAITPKSVKLNSNSVVVGEQTHMFYVKKIGGQYRVEIILSGEVTVKGSKTVINLQTGIVKLGTI